MNKSKEKIKKLKLINLYNNFHKEKKDNNVIKNILNLNHKNNDFFKEKIKITNNKLNNKEKKFEIHKKNMNKSNSIGNQLKINNFKLPKIHKNPSDSQYLINQHNQSLKQRNLILNSDINKINSKNNNDFKISVKKLYLLSDSKSSKSTNNFLHQTKKRNNSNLDKNIINFEKRIFSGESLKEIKIKENKIDLNNNNNNNNNNNYENNNLDSQNKRLINEIINKTNSQIKYSYLSVAGRNKEKIQKINQDNFLIINNEEFNLPFLIFAVFDGHGQYGHFISNFTKQYFYNYFIQNNNLSYFRENKNNLKIIKKYFSKNNLKNLFLSCENNLKNNFNSEYLNFSGTTCNIIILFDDYTLIDINVGDSRSVILQKQNNKVINLSNDHKPIEKNEKNRIIHFGGKIERFPKNALNGPYRVWYKNQNFPGLALSRSLGDLIASSIGVICEPEIKNYKINIDNEFCLIIASDGLWEYVQYDYIHYICLRNFYDNKNTEECVNDLYNYSVNLWKNNGNTIDDITIIVIFL